MQGLRGLFLGMTVAKTPRDFAAKMRSVFQNPFNLVLAIDLLAGGRLRTDQALQIKLRVFQGKLAADVTLLGLEELHRGADDL